MDRDELLQKVEYAMMYKNARFVTDLVLEEAAKKVRAMVSGKGAWGAGLVESRNGGLSDAADAILALTSKGTTNGR